MSTTLHWRGLLKHLEAELGDTDQLVVFAVARQAECAITQGVEGDGRGHRRVVRDVRPPGLNYPAKRNGVPTMTKVAVARRAAAIRWKGVRRENPRRLATACVPNR